jgi:PncC family amidohydrolase
MAEGALLRAAHELGGTSGVDHALAVTGIAGPEGGSEAKPVGTVWICRASREGSMDCRRFLFGGGRESVREWAAATALGMLRLKLAGEDLKLHSEQERWGE